MISNKYHNMFGKIDRTTKLNDVHVPRKSFRITPKLKT